MEPGFFLSPCYHPQNRQAETKRPKKPKKAKKTEKGKKTRKRPKRPKSQKTEKGKKAINFKKQKKLQKGKKKNIFKNGLALLKHLLIFIIVNRVIISNVCKNTAIPSNFIT